MPGIESPTPSPITITEGTLTNQAAFAYATDFQQRFQIALALTAEYILNQESTSFADHSDRAYFARYVIRNPIYYANQFASTIAADPGTIYTGTTDANIMARIYTLWPTFCYQAATIMATSTAAI